MNFDLEKFSNIMTIVGWFVTVISIPGTIFSTITILIRRKNISWGKIKKGIKMLRKEVDEIKPDFIISFSGRGGIVANYLVAELENKYPLYMCPLEKRQDDSFGSITGWKYFITSKWKVYIPDDILKLKDKKILIIDDITVTGETILNLQDELINQHGIKSENLFSMTLLANEQVHLNKNIPHSYWKKVNITKYTVPWGKTEEK